MRFPAMISGVGCPAAIIRLTAIRAIRTEVTAPEALTAVAAAAPTAGVTAAAAFDASRRRNQRLDRANPRTARVHSSMNPELSLESLQMAVFSFASSAALQYRRAPHHRWVCRINDCLFL
jgi:hypothetical protein